MIDIVKVTKLIKRKPLLQITLFLNENQKNLIIELGRMWSMKLKITVQSTRYHINSHAHSNIIF